MDKTLKVVKNHNLCLEGAGQQLILQNCVHSRAQMFELERDGRFRHLSSGQCVHFERTASHFLRLQSCDGSVNQQWTVVMSNI